jgi:molecular chaperone DnaK (HSP70)
MPYVLGIDIGDTRTSAAVSRVVGSTWTSPEVVRLDGHSSAVPSVLHVSANGSLAVGDVGFDGAPVGASRIARGFVRRLGDDAPLVVAGEPYMAEMLTAVLAMRVVERVVAAEGPADHIALSHPAGWGPYRRKLLRNALWDIGLGNVTLIPEPVAAAESHARRNFAGHALGVYAMGSSSFATSVVRRVNPTTFEVLSCLEGVEPLGGDDFDEALAGHVRAKLGRELGARQLDDPHVRLALFDLRGECVRAKERLSLATETDLVFQLPHGPTRVHVTRAEFEDLIRPALALTVDTLVRAVRSGDLRPDQLDGILLVGGSARIPLIAELIAAEFPGPVAVEADPAGTAAAGAAAAACQIVAPPGPGQHDPGWAPRPAARAEQGGEPPNLPQKIARHTPDEHREPPPRPPVTITPLKLPRMRSASRLVNARGFTLF